jgi:hypothetical protein
MFHFSISVTHRRLTQYAFLTGSNGRSEYRTHHQSLEVTDPPAVRGTHPRAHNHAQHGTHPYPLRAGEGRRMLIVMEGVTTGGVMIVRCMAAVCHPHGLPFDVPVALALTASHHGANAGAVTRPLPGSHSCTSRLDSTLLTPQDVHDSFSSPLAALQPP